MSEKKSKKKKQLVNKAKKIRSIVMMSLMCIMLLSAATYAWFSLSNSAKMSNLTMTVGEATGLQIAAVPKNNDTSKCDWQSNYSLVTDDMKGQLKPATFDGSTFYKPNYDDNGNVSGVTNIATDGTENLTYPNNDDNQTGYYYEVKFYMMSKGGDSSVCLVKGTNITESASRKGTYVVSNGTSKGAEKAVRIAITTGTGNIVSTGANVNTVVYEPNNTTEENEASGKSAGMTYAKMSSNVTTIKQNSDGTFGGGGNSSAVISLSANTPTLITLKIWIEGEDKSCVNEISMESLIGQLQFEQMS